MRGLILLVTVFLSACFPTKRTLPQPDNTEVLLFQALDTTVALVNGQDAYCTGSFYRGDNILTAAHCVGENTAINVMTRKGKVYGYTVAKTDETQDIALLVPAEWVEEHPHFTLAPQAPTRGQKVVLIGHPYGMTWSLFQGHVNNPIRYGWSGDGEDVWMMYDCAGGPGTSGGPVLNVYGELVGINIWSPTRGGGWRAAVHHSQIDKFLEVKEDAVDSR